MADLALIDAPNETARAKEAFTEYLLMGPDRSLAKLAARHGKTRSYVVQLERWSKEHHWQDRIKAHADQQLGQATELKTTTYVTILGEYHRRVSDEPRRQIMELTALHGIYDRVKPETSNDGSSGSGSIIVQFAFIEAVRGDE